MLEYSTDTCKPCTMGTRGQAFHGLPNRYCAPDVCPDPKLYINGADGKCTKCPGGKVAMGGRCVIPLDYKTRFQ